MVTVLNKKLDISETDEVYGYLTCDYLVASKILEEAGLTKAKSGESSFHFEHPSDTLPIDCKGVSLDEDLEIRKQYGLKFSTRSKLTIGVQRNPDVEGILQDIQKKVLGHNYKIAFLKPDNGIVHLDYLL